MHVVYFCSKKNEMSESVACNAILCNYSVTICPMNNETTYPMMNTKTLGLVHKTLIPRINNPGAHHYHVSICNRIWMFSFGTM